LSRGKLDEAVSEYRTAIELDSKLAVAHRNLGIVLFMQRQDDEALTQFHQALELNPGNAVAHATLGTVLRNRGQREDAIAEYRRALALDPGLATVHAFLGTLLFEQGTGGEAMVELQRARELDPHLSNSLHTLASELVQQALRSGSASQADATLIDACWALVTAKHLAPANVDYPAAVRRIDRRLGGRQHCPPGAEQVNSRKLPTAASGSNTAPFQAPKAH
jgi:Tfp pilus assembly protein PilF